MTHVERVNLPPLQQQFEKMFALWLYSTGMDFNKVAHDSCGAALEMLHPGAKAPSQHALRGPLLDKCYQESLDKLRVALARQKATLVSDAWTDVNGLSVINYVATSGNDTFFLESVYTGSESHGASFLANDISRVMQKYGFIRFVAVVTDNTSANRNAWKILQEEYPRSVLPRMCCPYPESSRERHREAATLVETIGRKLQDPCHVLQEEPKALVSFKASSERNAFSGRKHASNSGDAL
ncbi:Transposase [Phytophthora megakarya]|uniref:Transposase n=1 Tax=Phytophthora megakarya TaxID=4795 RepID=A0A225V0T7_9STRA|nr:Transposase [Phytophthora megakarya]